MAWRAYREAGQLGTAAWTKNGQTHRAHAPATPESSECILETIQV